MGETCALCGKTLDWRERNTVYWNRQLRDGYVKIVGNKREECPEFKDKRLCLSCAWYELPFHHALKQGRRIVVISDEVMTADGVPKHIQKVSLIAEKYGYVFKQQSILGPNAFMMTFEKIVTTTNETNYINCKYCNTRYDANQYFKCPQCGSPNTQTIQTSSSDAGTHGHRTEKKPIDFEEENTDENTDEMLEEGYVLNMENGKWEKPTDTRARAR